LDGTANQNTDSLHYTDRDITVRGLKKTLNGSLYQTCTIANYNPISYQYGILKYDSNGILQFHNTDTTKYDFIYVLDIVALTNKDFMSVGTVRTANGSDPGDQKIILIKSDSLGNEIWKKTYQYNSFDHNGQCISLCKDGGYIIGGAEVDYTVVPWYKRPLVMKVDSNGKMLWRKTYGSYDFGNSPVYGITPTQDGGYAFVGAVGIEPAGIKILRSPWVVKLNQYGYITWSDTNTPQAPTLHDNDYTDIIELKDSSLVLCGNHTSWDSTVIEPAKNRVLGVIAKYHTNGSKIWERNYRHPEAIDKHSTTHILSDIKLTPDGGFVAAGYLTHSTDNTQDTWVIKVDSFGCLAPGCEVTSVPQIEGSVSQLKIYPNPANEVLNIDITPNSLNGNQNEFLFELYDMLGKLVLSKKLHPYQNTVSVVSLKQGVYSYRMGEVSGKIVKQF
jgi:hypothetical protein